MEIIKAFATKAEAERVMKKLTCKHKKLKEHITFLGQLNYIIEIGKDKYLLTTNKVFKK